MHSCSCCLQCPPDKDLTTPYKNLGKIEIYADMIKECFDINLVVGVSSSCGICSACVGRLRDASDFKLQVQRSQAELQALLVKAESAVKSEQADDGADDKSVVDVLYEVPILVEQAEVGEKTKELRDEDPLVKSETDDVMSDGDSSAAACSAGSAARAREQLATACSVVLERLRGDATANSKKKPYGCEHCDKRFRNKFILRKHIEDTHLSTEPKPFACDLCNSTFQTKLLVIEHEKSEHGVTNFMCAECEYATSSKKTLETHLKSHSLENNFNCSHCSYTSSCKTDLHKHQTLHTAGKSEYRDPDFKYSVVSNLQLNQKTHNRMHGILTEKQPYKCSHCDYECKTGYLLQIHEKTYTGEKPFRCNYCDRKFCHKSSLKTHQRIHTGERTYTCSHCDHKCRTGYLLEIHKRTHTGEKPYICSHCDRKFCHQSSLKLHQRIHTGERPYTCSHCDYTCRSSSDKRKHERIHTGEKPFQCSHCDFKCIQKSYLRTHRMIHTGAKPFQCTHCEYKSNDISHLRRHQKKHQEAKTHGGDAL